MNRFLAVLALCAITSLSAYAGRYDTIVSELQSIAADHPNSAKLFSIGKNDDGRDIQAIRFSTNPAKFDLTKVGHLVVGTHHGNELGAPQLVMELVRRTADRFSSRNVFRDEITETEWTFVPVLNISGYDAGRRQEKGVDPNRDYPGPCTDAPGGKLKSTSALRKLHLARPFVGAVTVHGYIGALVYPWGMNVSDTHTPDHDRFDEITAEAASKNGYKYGTSTDVVYPADGCYEDWAYWKLGSWALLVELLDGSDDDIYLTADAVQTYFEGLDKAPSSHHTVESGCQRAGALDLHNE